MTPAAHLGGIEQTVLHLAAALRARGHGVSLATDPAAPCTGIAVAVNDAALLPARADRPVVWFHNEVGFWREARKGRLPALFCHRPAAVFVGTVQARQASRLLPFRSRHILPHGLPQAFLAAAPASAPPAPRAVFASQPYRGLGPLLTLWRNTIEPSQPASRLTAYVPPDSLAAWRACASATIDILPRAPNDAMPGILRAARLLLAPGHEAETFCLAAAEAVAMGVPVVTYGTGALRERVVDGVTGFICRDAAGMAARIAAILTDDALWRRMHAAGLATRPEAGWDRAAQRWEAFLVAQ